MVRVKTTTMVTCLKIFLLLVSVVSCNERNCLEITIPMCKGIGYNLTSMPNEFNHDTQDEAGLEVHQFWPLVEINCSPDLKFFLCSMYAPICIEDYHYPLPACRSVCMRAKTGCAPLMRQYGFMWPERMNCDKLPEYGIPDRLCMDHLNGTAPKSPEPTPSYPKSGKGANSLSPTRKGRPNQKTKSNKNSSFQLHANFSFPTRDCSCKCKPPLIEIEESSPNHNMGVFVGSEDNCALPCRGVFFTKEEQAFANFWIALCAIVCCVATFMTLLTFLVDMQRFKYPERPIIYLSGCYLMVSIGYIIRVAVGHEEIACEGEMIRYQYKGQFLCPVVFIFIYFFYMASSIWWVVLSFTWFLAAGLKWGNEAIAGYSRYFHLSAWVIPFIQTAVVLTMNAVDGDTVAGICYVGNQNITNLRGFVLAPLFIYLILGTSFLLAGFVSLFRIRSVIKQQGRARADKLEKLMIRIGIFSVLYTVPASIVIGCYFYEQHFREEWLRPIVCPCQTVNARPDYAVYMLKYFMSLAVGITSGFWICSGKTLESWKAFYYRLAGKTLPPPAYQAQPPIPPPRTVKQLPFPTAPSVQSSHTCIGTVQKQLPLSHV